MQIFAYDPSLICDVKLVRGVDNFTAEVKHGDVSQNRLAAIIVRAAGELYEDGPLVVVRQVED